MVPKMQANTSGGWARKMLSVLLSIVLVTSMIPGVSAWAKEENATDNAMQQYEVTATSNEVAQSSSAEEAQASKVTVADEGENVSSSSTAANEKGSQAAQAEQSPQEAFDADLSSDTHSVTAAVTGSGTVTVTADGAQATTLDAVAAGTTVTVNPVVAEGFYLAQVRLGQNAVTDNAESLVYEPLKQGSDGTWSFVMPKQDVLVYADFVSIVWDGTLDVTWYNTTDSSFNIQYAAQYEGLAAIVNGVFTNYPTSPNSDGIQICDYYKYLAGMGTKWKDSKGNISSTHPSDYDESGKDLSTVLGSACYGEFTAKNTIFDTQGQTASSSLSVDIAVKVTSTQRVVGNPDYVKANCSDTVQREGSQNLVTTSSYFYGIDYFHNKTINVTADLDFGGVKRSDGTWSTEESPLFMPIAGQYIMLPIVIEKFNTETGEYEIDSSNGYNHIGSSFCGTLDGHGHSFSNVYCEHYGYGTNFGDSQSVGLVGRLGIHDNDYLGQGVVPPVNPTVRCIVLESGYVSSRRSVGGIVGKIGHTSRTDLKDGTTGGIVEYCINKADTFNTDAKGSAGIVGCSWNGGAVRYCANFGRIFSTYSDPQGGIVAYNENDIINCYNVGTVENASESNARFAMGIGSHNGGSYEIENNYWLLGSAQNDYLSSSYQYGGYYGIVKGTEQGKSNNGTWSFGGTITTWDKKVTYSADYPTLTAALLNNGGPEMWKEPTSGANCYNGVNYPELYYQAEGYVETDYKVSIVQPEEHGSISVDKTSGTYGTVIKITPQADTGYVVDTCYVDGKAIDGDTFVLTGDATVTATFKALKAYTFHYENPDTEQYTFSATKDGLVIKDGISSRQTDVEIEEGDTVYEGDVITVSLELKEGAAPEDITYEYTGGYSLKLTYADAATKEEQSKTFLSSSKNLSYTVTGNEDTETKFSLSLISLTSQLKTWTTKADTSWYDGSNPQTSYVLTTPEQLAGFNALLKQKVTFEGITITLGSDISLANNDGTQAPRYWENQTMSSYVFKGIFDGEGHTISGIVTPESGSSSSCAAFIGYATNATIKDVTVSGTMNTSSTGSGTLFAAGIVGVAENCTLKNLTSKVALTSAKASAGGIVASAKGGTITDCTNCAPVKNTYATSSTTLGSAGGICGSAQGVAFTHCLNKAEVSSNTCAGGIVAAGSFNADYGQTVVSQCGNLAPVAVLLKGAYTCYAGGVCGNSTAVKLSESFNAGAISAVGEGSSGNLYTGGLIAYGSKGSSYLTSDISDCFNVGAISATTDGQSGALAAGGAIGYSNNIGWNMTNCYSAAEVSATGGKSTSVGQFVAYRKATTSGATYAISNSYYLTGAQTSAFDTQATAVSTDEMKDLAAKLGEVYTASTEKVREVFPALSAGYPVQTWVANTACYDIADATISPIADQEYTGSGIEPRLSVTYEGHTLVLGVDYETSYSNNVKVGTATVKVTGKGSYSGTLFAQFEIECTQNIIIEQPQSLQIAVGEYASFTIEAGGNVESYEWQSIEHGGTWQSAASWTGWDTDKVTFRMTTALNGCQWRCVVTFTDGSSVTSEVAISRATGLVTVTRGDVNDNATINIMDAQIVFDMANDKWTSAGSQTEYNLLLTKLNNGWIVDNLKEAADANADTKITADDARAIQYYAHNETWGE